MKPTNEALKNYQISDISYDKGANIAKATFTEDLSSSDKSSLKEIIVDTFGVKPGWVGQNGMVLSIPEKEFNNFQKLLILDLQMRLADEEVTSEASDSSSPNLGNNWNETPDGHMSINVDQGKVQGEFTIIPETEETFKLLWSPREFSAGDIEVDTGLPTVEAAKDAAESYAENHLGIGNIYEDVGESKDVMESLSSMIKGSLIKENKSDSINFIGRNDMEKQFAKEAFDELGEEFWMNAKEEDFEIEQEDIESAEGEEVWSVLHDHNFTGLGGATEEEARENLKKALAVMQGASEAKDTDDNDIVEGDEVIVVGRTDQEGKKGTVVETSDSSDFVIVEIKGKNYSYHASDLRKVEETEEDDDDEADFDTENTYEYVVDLDERGDFQAHIEDVDGEVVYEIDGIDDLNSLIEDGFMKDKNDTDGLLKHLQDVGILDKYAILENLVAKIDKFINEAFREGTASHFDSLLKEWSKKSGIDYEMKFKEFKGKSKPYFVLKTNYEGYDALPSEIKTELNGLLKKFGVDFSYKNKMWTPVIEGIKEDFGDDDQLALDNSEPEYEVFAEVDGPVEMKTIQKVAQRLEIPGSPDTGFIVSTKVLLRKFVNTLRGFDLAVSKILDGHNNEVALASIEAYKPKGRPTNKYNYPNRMHEEKLIKGSALSPDQKKLVLSAFVYRNTKENEQAVRKALKDRADKMKFDVSDDKWIEDHAFWFNNDGKALSGRKKYAEPAYIAD